MPAKKRRRFLIRKKRRIRKEGKKRIYAAKKVLWPKRDYTIKGEANTRNGIRYYIADIRFSWGIKDATISIDGKILINARLPPFLQEASANHEKAELDYIKRTPAKKFSLEECHKLGKRAAENFVLKNGTTEEIASWKHYKSTMKAFGTRLKRPDQSIL